KRIRGTSLEMTVETIQTLAHPESFDPAQIDAVALQLLQALEAAPKDKNSTDNGSSKIVADVKRVREQIARLLADDKSKQALTIVMGGPLPKVEAKVLDKKESQEAIDAVVKAIAQRQTESETAPAVSKLSPADIDAATRHAEQAADAFDKAIEPISEAVRILRTALGELAAAVAPLRKGAGQSQALSVAALDSLTASFRAVVLDFDRRRYAQESYYNRKAAEMYEVRVRRSAVESDRHRER